MLRFCAMRGSLLKTFSDRKIVRLASRSMSRYAFATVNPDLSYYLAGSERRLGEVGCGVFMLSSFRGWFSCFSESEKLKIFGRNILYSNI